MKFGMIKLMGFDIHTSIQGISLGEEKTIVATLNPHSYCIAKRDKTFDKALSTSDILLPDGIGIVLAARVIHGEKIKKIAGADIHTHLLKLANLEGLRVFYLGATVRTLELIKKRVQKEYPRIHVATFSPPFKEKFSPEETNTMISIVNKFRPDILFVGMTAPKQEKWVYLNKDVIEVNFVASIGAVFDFYAGTVKRSSPIWIHFGLEWLPRLMREPRRMFKRMFISAPKFVLDVLALKVFGKGFKIKTITK